MSAVELQAETLAAFEKESLEAEEVVCEHGIPNIEGYRCKRCMPRRKKPSRWKTEGYSKRLQNRWNYYGGRCYLCGDEASTWDHVKPQSKGGSRYLPCNLRPACGPCNNAKGNLWPMPEFMRVTNSLHLGQGELIDAQRDKLRRQAHIIAKQMAEIDSLKVRNSVLKAKMEAMVEHDHCEWRLENQDLLAKVAYYEEQRMRERHLP